MVLSCFISFNIEIRDSLGKTISNCSNGVKLEDAFKALDASSLTHTVFLLYFKKL